MYGARNPYSVFVLQLQSNNFIFLRFESEADDYEVEQHVCFFMGSGCLMSADVDLLFLG